MRQSTLDGFETADYTDPDWLRARYYDDEMTMQEMADLADVSYSAIYQNMDKNGIERRGTGESVALRGTGRKTGRHDEKEWLEQKYHEDTCSLKEMAEMADVSVRTILDRMEEHGIERRSRTGALDARGTRSWNHTETHDYNRKEWLEQKYHDENLTIDEMAAEADVAHETVRRNMIKQDVEILSYPVKRAVRDPGAGYVFQNDDGYESVVVSAGGNTGRTVGIHRLIAIAEHGYEAVKDAVVHHKNGCPLDNRPENLQIMSDDSEHMTHHWKEWKRKQDELGEDVPFPIRQISDME